jgi:hydrogenase nickel incorporation protein HypA/HybF
VTVHEYAIVGALVAQVQDEARKHADPRVTRVRIRVGALAGVDTVLLRTAWDLFREGTGCAEAVLEIVEEPVCWRCSACAAPIAPGAVLRCAACGAPARLERGDALVLERIEMEVGDV